MSTLREAAEQIVAEAIPCFCKRPDIFGHFDSCAFPHRAAALSAVLKGMRLVVEGDAAICDVVKIPEDIVGEHQPSKWRNSALMMAREAIRAQLRELGEEEKR